MRHTSVLITLGAGVCWALACEPQELRLFETLAQPSPAFDAGADDEVPEAGGPSEPSAPPEQPDCLTPACDQCRSRGCEFQGTPWLCHPSSGGCSPPCDRTSDDPACPSGLECHPDYGLCVECTGDEGCSAPTPACDLAQSRCVECTGDDDCGGARPACDTQAQRCVPCTEDRHCTAGLVCDTETQLCVQCRNDADCPAPGGDDDDVRCELATQRCVECLSDNDCTDPDKPFCKLSEFDCDDERR